MGVAQPDGRQRYQRLKESLSQRRSHAQRSIVRSEPFAVPQHTTTDPKRANEHRGNHQRQNWRVLGGSSDQPPDVAARLTAHALAPAPKTAATIKRIRTPFAHADQ